MRTPDFDYHLPPDLIAQHPALRRDNSRLLVLDRATGSTRHGQFGDLSDALQPGDTLVLNDSRVIPARLRGTKIGSGGQFEILLHEQIAVNDWWVLLRPGKRVRSGTRLQFFSPTGEPASLHAEVLEKNGEGHCRLQFIGTPDVRQELETLGEIPLPPYIARESPVLSAEDRERYQTVFARPPGSVAAPTAGLHFTEAGLQELRGRGVRVHFVTLHVGLGTFAPVKTDSLTEHVMHEERYELPAATAAAINETKAAGRRVFAVGTTSVRVLETVAANQPGPLVSGSGRTRIFIHPPYTFRIVDALLTNFHLPQSTLLMLVSAFASPGGTRGRERVLAAYAEAVRARYRFFSYGDAMLIL